MSAKRAAKRNLFTLLGWLVWKILAVFGVKAARRKLDERDERLHGSGGGVTGRLRRSVGRGKR